MRRLAAVLAAAVFLAACGGEEAPPAPPDSGIEGTVLLGPLCPVVQEGSPCPDRPLAAEIVVREESGEEVDRVRSGEDGRFRVNLPPGDYILDPLPPDPDRPFPIAPSMPVTVVAGAFTEVVINYDTGIR